MSKRLEDIAKWCVAVRDTSQICYLHNDHPWAEKARTALEKIKKGEFE